MHELQANFEFYSLLAAALLLGALAAILPLFLACYGFIAKFATKAELTAIEQRSDTRYQENKAGRETLEGRFTHQLRQLEDRISNGIAENRGNNDHRFGEIGAKVDSLNTTVQLFANETSRVVGLLEGKMQLMEKIAQAKLEAPNV